MTDTPRPNFHRRRSKRSREARDSLTPPRSQFLEEVNELSKALADTLSNCAQTGKYRRGSILAAILIVSEAFIEQVKKDGEKLPESVELLLGAMRRVHDDIGRSLNR